MAFQMIPPRLSSSPPPIDSLPTVVCPEEEEEDEQFGSFSTNNSSFDITGLSDKLPPTPASSPVKIVECRLPALVPEDAGDIETESSEMPPFPPQSMPDLDHRDVEFGAGDEKFGAGNDEFGAFQTLNEGKEQDSGVDFHTGVDLSENSRNDQVEKSYTIVDCEDNSPSTSHLERDVDENEAKETKAVPPLPHSNLKGGEFSNLSENLAFSDEDDDFGDFATSTLTSVGNTEASNVSKLDSSECLVTDSNINEKSVPVVLENLGMPTFNSEEASSGVHSELNLEISRTESPKCIVSDDDTTEVKGTLTENAKLEGGNDINKGSTINTKKKHSEVNDSKSSKHNECINSSSLFESTPDNSNNTTDKQESCSWTSQTSVVGINDITVQQNNSLDHSTTSEFVQSASNYDDIECNMLNTEARSTHINLEPSEKDERLYCEDEDDFGDFDRANYDDDDELDFEDLRKKVEEGDFGEDESLPSNPDDDFGDFGHFDAKNEDEADDSFGDFSSPSVNEIEGGKLSGANDVDDNDFGDFSAHDKVSESLSGEAVNDDEFGAFGEPSGDGEFGSFSTSRSDEGSSADPPASWADTTFEAASATSPVLQKLEALVKKWVPSCPDSECSKSLSASKHLPLPPSLHEVVESDAFVWRRLETKLESCPGLTVSWAATQAHAAFLNAVGVDARNILFGQKWSSSVPLFAQTLSFSPLTPAKPGEGSSNNSNRDTTTTTTITPSTTTTITTTTPPISRATPLTPKDQPSTQPSPVKDIGSEEQIPLPKFDWTSSGLTNPLEGPGLEEEFLRDGGGDDGQARPPAPNTSSTAPSPLVQQILGGGRGGSGGAGASVTLPTPLHGLNQEVRDVVEELPDLSYMRSRVLMFPIRHHQ